jgi:hypothetical protein
MPDSTSGVQARDIIIHILSAAATPIARPGQRLTDETPTVKKKLAAKRRTSTRKTLAPEPSPPGTIRMEENICVTAMSANANRRYVSDRFIDTSL